jgi:selenocysteine lyase/cysteine desulfurase
MISEVNNAIESIRKFTGCSSDKAFLFGSNTSDMILKLARLNRFSSKDKVLVSDVEHTSNYLPWKCVSNATLTEFESDKYGSFFVEDVEKALQENEGIKLVAITGASNVTGFIPNLKKISRVTHEYGAKIFVDAAQLVPHRMLEVEKNALDFVAFSAHKLYAPYGLGVLIAPKDWLEEREPIDPAGGSPDYIYPQGVVWNKGIYRHQPGTWNSNGIICLSEAMKVLKEIGWKKIFDHERELMLHCLNEMEKIPGIEFLVPKEKFEGKDRTSTVSFKARNYHYALVSSFLANEYAISTRSGEICNYRLLAKWNKLTESEVERIADKVANGDLLSRPGLVRASIGLFNTLEDIDALVIALKQLMEKGPILKYAPVSLPEPSFEVVV